MHVSCSVMYFKSSLHYGQTIKIHGTGDETVNGLYHHRSLEEDYFEKIEPQKHIKFEIDYREYIQCPEDIPDERLSKSGCWILSRTDVYPKQMLYAVNCPFSDKLKTNGWIVLEEGTSPAPQIAKYDPRLCDK